MNPARSILPRRAQSKVVKKRIVGMCGRCGREFFSSKERRDHPPKIGCGN